MTLLVATQDPDATAETYVRQHMRAIAPDRTVGLGFSVSQEGPDWLPFFAVEQPRNPVARKIGLVRGHWQYGFAGAPSGARRRDIVAFLRKHDVQLVLAEFGPTGAALREICASEHIPLIVNFHGYDATVMPKRSDIRAAYALLGRDAAGFLCGSEHFRETVAAAGIPRDRITVIPCGVRTSDFSAHPDRSGHRLITVGRLTRKKSPISTLRAFVEARRVCPDLELDMIGDGPLMPECVEFVARNHLTDCVTLRGRCDHGTVRDALARADIFMQHSVVAQNGDTESQGISLIEAMASALPVVTTNHNGFSETVVQGQTGFLVEEGDVIAMAARTVELATHSAHRRRMGQAGLERARAHFEEAILINRLRDYLSTFADI